MAYNPKLTGVIATVVNRNQTPAKTTTTTSNLPSGLTTGALGWAPPSTGTSTGTTTTSKKTSGGSGGGGGGMSTILTPTPSAETLTGTPVQREQQTQAFQGRTITSQLQSQPSAVVTPGRVQDVNAQIAQPSLFGRLTESGRAALNVGTIGQYGFTEYYRSIVGPGEKTTVTSGLAPTTDFRQTSKGTQMTEFKTTYTTTNPLATTVSLVETGALVAASTTPVGAVGVTLYSFGKGIPEIGKATLGTGTTRERVVSGAAGVFDISAGGLIGGYGVGAVKGSLITTQLDKEILAGLNKQSVLVSGKEVIRGTEGSLFKIYGTRGSKEAVQEVEFTMPVFKNIKGDVFGTTETGQRVLLEKGSEVPSFFITKGKAETKIFNVLSGETTKTTTLFGGGGKIPYFSKTVNYVYPSMNFKIQIPGVTGSAGGGYIKLKPSGQLKPFRFAGLTQETEETYQIVSGNIRKGSPFVRPSSIGEIQKFQPQITEKFGVQTSSGGRTLLKTTLKPISSTPVQTIVQEVSKINLGQVNIPKTFTQTITATKTVPSTSLYAGTGLYERTQEYSMSMPKLAQVPLIETRQRFGLVTLQATTPSSREVFPPGVIQIPKPTTGTRQLITPTQITIPRETTTTRQIPTTITTPTPFTPTANFPVFTPIVPIVPFPLIPGFSETYGFRRPKRKGRKYKYQASFTAGILGIKSSKMPKQLSIGGYSGLRIRPLIVGRSRRKKRK